MSSRYGDWATRDGLPAFGYRADHRSDPEAEWDPLRTPRTRLHWVMLGNRGIQIQATNDGTVGLWDERHSQRWLAAPHPEGTGISILEQEDGARWGTACDDWPAGEPALRTFGPTWFEVEVRCGDVTLERLIACPEGEVPWVLVRVRLRNEGATTIELRHVERWAVRPRFVNLTGTPESRRNDARDAVHYRVVHEASALVAFEERTGRAAELEGYPFPQVHGPPIDLRLEALGDTQARVRTDGESHPVLELVTDVSLTPGATEELWFRFGARDHRSVPNPGVLLERSLTESSERLPRASARAAPQAEREVPWHAALLTGGASRDAVLGDHTLNQGSAYAYDMGFNGAARDPLQHALPLIYFEPGLALSVLRNTCSWADPEGELPYALDGAKQPWTAMFRPSDQNLWALWLAAEYAAATGDLGAFDQLLSYHPAYGAPAAPLREHLRRQLRFFIHGVGRGEHGHLRMRNADWNDAAIALSGIDRELMIERGESVLNSAMAAWVLPVYAGLCRRLGDEETASEAQALGDELRRAVAGEWNGRWFRRAYAPGKGALGEEKCWLEVQPWAVLCGAADEDRSRQLLATLDELRAGSPLGARVLWPVPTERDVMGFPGDGTAGGIWFSINLTLVWAFARLSPERAWEEWRRMTLHAHTEAYPEIWEGTLSGPDTFNAPESRLPGRTWGTPAFAMQSFPVNNLHSHAGPLLAYLRLLGVEPSPGGELRVGGGGSFESRGFRLDPDGHGHLEPAGPVTVVSRHGVVQGAGPLQW
jgi:hypothetical protein